MIVDTHNHLHQLPESAPGRYGIARCCSCGTSPDDWQAVQQLAEQESTVVPALGLHPWFIEITGSAWETLLSKYLEANPNAAVGEVGLDKTRRSPSLDRQLPVLKAQLRIARDLRRPVVLHCVGAYGTMFDVLAASGLESPTLLHGYAGSAEMTTRFLSLPFPVFFSTSAGRIAAVPEDRLLLESDASPDNGRTPAHVVGLHEELGISPAVTARNFAAMFPTKA